MEVTGTASPGSAALAKSPRSVDDAWATAAACRLTRSDLTPWLARLVPVMTDLRQRGSAQTLPASHDAIAAAATHLAALSAQTRTLVFFAQDRTSLAGQALAQLAGWNIPGGADRMQKSRPRTRFYDTIDPTTIAGALYPGDLPHTRFIVTATHADELAPLIQTIAAITALHEAGLTDDIPGRFLGVLPADPSIARDGGGLYRLFAASNAPMLDLAADPTQSLDLLSLAALVPAMARGLDAAAIVAAAAACCETVLATNPDSCAPAVDAAILAALLASGRCDALAIIPQADRLGRLAAWMVRAYDDALDPDARTANQPAPFANLRRPAVIGPIDPLSPLPAAGAAAAPYLTFLSLGVEGAAPLVTADTARAIGQPDLAGTSVAAIVQSIHNRQAEGPAADGHLARVIHIPQLDAASIGGLLMHLGLELILLRALAGRDGATRAASSPLLVDPNKP